MELKANRKRQEVEFKVSDMVLVKLQPYRQLALAKRLSNKLAKRYYGPYEVVERIGKVAYRLALPATSRIHLESHDGWHVEQPLAVCDSREVLQNGKPFRQVLLLWDGESPEEATWEGLSEFQNAYPYYNLEDKVVFEEMKNVTPAVQQKGRARRIRTARVLAARLRDGLG
uniref:Tf2-1-like SH3-like domain-containing protein n=1 Tax=Tanacetum cinerariifolium TaxID=118510 RepID=A0A6L2JXB7_TANCI|nr:hypothetical protein [Tanacetum cinerariifolium]